MNELYSKRTAIPKMSRKKLAAICNCSAHYIYLLETGKRKPGLDIANKLQEVLGLATTYWPTEIEAPSS